MCSRADAGQQRVHTVSRKSERLVNLTIALLATKRYLTKSEIFRTVEGYEGSAEAMERMFERDKDDLRGLGIAIELGTFDPLFDDEAGYRITPSSYQLDLGALDGRDIALLSLAASSWSGAAMEEVSTSALVKLESIGIDADLESISLSPRIGATNSVFTAITDAIMRRAILSFDYVSADLTVSTRELHPFALRGRAGSWFLIAFDVNKGEQRTFRLDRISGEVSVGKKSGAFTTPSTLQEESTEDQPVATLLLRKNRGNQFRANAISIEFGDEWDTAQIPIFSYTWILSLILWHRDDVVVIEPQSLRQETIRALQEVKSAHG
jgi:proteasome accessory factor B